MNSKEKSLEIFGNIGMSWMNLIIENNSDSENVFLEKVLEVTKKINKQKQVFSRNKKWFFKFFGF